MKIIIFFAALIAYIASAPPAVTTGDSGEFITSAVTLGISHPPGFPLFCLLGKIFSLVPLANPAWRITGMSALFTAVSALLLYMILCAITANRFAALYGALAFVFAKTVWAQSILAEVYSLNAFFTVLCLWFLVLWSRYEDERYLYLFGLAYGCSLANHYPLMLVSFPAYALFILLHRRLLSARIILISVLFSVLALGLYAYLPVRSRANPPNDWGNPESVTTFVRHFLRAQYKTTELGAAVATGDKIRYLKNVFLELYRQFGLLVVLALAGFAVSFVRFRQYFWFALALLLSNGILLTLILRFSFNPERLSIINVYYIPAYLAAAMGIAAGAAAVFDGYGRSASVRKIFIVLLAALIVAPAVSSGVSNYQRENLLAYDLGKNILRSAAKNAALFILKAGDEALFSTLYLQQSAGVRTDLRIIDCWGNVFASPYGDDFPFLRSKEEWLERRKRLEPKIIASVPAAYYATFTPTETEGIAHGVANGLVYRVGKGTVPAGALWEVYNFRGTRRLAYPEYQERELVGFYGYAQGNALLSADRKKGFAYLAAAGQAAHDVSWLKNNIGLAYYHNGVPEKAIGEYQSLLKEYPEYTVGWYNLGLAYAQIQQSAQAQEAFKKCIELAPYDLDAYKELADIYWKEGQREKAGRILGTALKNKLPYAKLYHASGSQYYLNKNVLRAIEEWQKAVLVWPDYAAVYYNLGVAHAERGNFREARGMFARFLEIEPDTELSASVRAYMKDFKRKN